MLIIFYSSYIDKAIDESWLKVYEYQSKYENVTQVNNVHAKNKKIYQQILEFFSFFWHFQGVLLVNMKGYNVVQHACLQCIPIILRGILTYERYYPGLAHKIFLINSKQTSFLLINFKNHKKINIFCFCHRPWSTFHFWAIATSHPWRVEPTHRKSVANLRHEQRRMEPHSAKVFRHGPNPRRAWGHFSNGGWWLLIRGEDFVRLFLNSG